MEQILFETLCTYMGGTDPGAKRLIRHYVKPNISTNLHNVINSFITVDLQALNSFLSYKI